MHWRGWQRIEEALLTQILNKTVNRVPNVLEVILQWASVATPAGIGFPKALNVPARQTVGAFPAIFAEPPVQMSDVRKMPPNAVPREPLFQKPVTEILQ
jgi:hypothetical protein